jgi:hypothetical protein
MEKQTAVELLIEDLTRLGHNFKLYKKEIEHAKEMEKQQLIDFYCHTNTDDVILQEFAEQYYKKTFNK